MELTLAEKKLLTTLIQSELDSLQNQQSRIMTLDNPAEDTPFLTNAKEYERHLKLLLEKLT